MNRLSGKAGLVMSRRQRRNGNRRDQYGIYELSEYNKKKKTKKRKKMTLRSFLGTLIRVAVIITALYGISIGIKYSMQRKAISLYEKEDYEGALNLFEEALTPQLPLLEDFDNDVRLYLADCHVNMGNYGYACCEYSKIKVWSDGKEIPGLNKLQKIAYGLQLYDWQDYREALPILLEAYESGYGSLVLYVGSCYGQIGDLGNMQIYYDVFLQNNPMNSFMYAQYAAISLDEGKMEEALGYIEMGKQLDDQSNIRELLFDEIVYYEKLKDYNTAYEKAKTFVEMYPGDVGGKNEYDLLFTRQTLSEQK
ncbi:MAG: tetratricopeptide repeat protein [Lachnospiraceae bacterium]|nr:tetratricopeptide repeat protein [Lachnospiraceae bacterium]